MPSQTQTCTAASQDAPVGVKFEYLKGEPEDPLEEDSAAQPQPEPAVSMN
jgi:hypothetical protein